MIMTTTVRGRVRVEHGERRLRGYVRGTPVFDSVRPVLVWESPHYPAYYVPLDDVREGTLVATDSTEHSPSRGEADVYSIRVGEHEIPAAARVYPQSPLEEIRAAVRFDWAAIDSWFEEDEQIFTHPRDPYTRVDILPSSRRVQVEADGVSLADSVHARALFETGLPVRWYLPKVDVRMELLTPTNTSTGCPYKGTAQYWSARFGDTVIDDVAWSYPTPLPESDRIAGFVSFYPDKVQVSVDGVPLGRPAP